MNPARQIAFDLLWQVHQGRRPLDHHLEAAEARLMQLARADRALVHALVYGTLRWQGQLDFIIDELARKSGRIDSRVRIILRLGLFQMQHLDRVPISAVVNTAVELAKHNDCAWAAGFVNGLLRSAARSQGALPRPDAAAALDLSVSVRHAFPRWMTSRWIDRLGIEETERLCEAVNSIPALTIRTNTLATDRSSLAASIQAEVRQVHLTRHSPEGLVLDGLARPLTQWPAFRQGWFQVQDEAAQIVAHLLGPLPGETVWDACAGLGTKTAHLAQLMENRGFLLATDLQADKLDRLRNEMERLGITIVSRRCMDLTTSASPPELPLFDRILVDAPCSGLGVLQKNPDGKWRLSDTDLPRCQQRQIELLERTCGRLRPGGILVYAVCSFEPEENESVAKAFLQNHPEFAIHTPSMETVTLSDRLLTRQGWLKTFPQRHGMDGFFAAAFVKSP